MCTGFGKGEEFASADGERDAWQLEFFFGRILGVFFQKGWLGVEISIQIVWNHDLF